MPQLHESDAIEPAFQTRLSETRIGLFDSSEATRTEPLGFVSGSSHRASIDSWREVTTDLDLYTQPDPIGLGGGPNLFGYALANPAREVDPLGLSVLICNRRSKSPPIGNHAYFWDTTLKVSCSMQGSELGTLDYNPNEHSPHEKGPGPNGDSCSEIPGSAGQEVRIIACCRLNSNKGTWRPFKNDCHNALSRCLVSLGFTDIPAPGGRAGYCGSCQNDVFAFLSDFSPWYHP